MTQFWMLRNGTEILVPVSEMQEGEHSHIGVLLFAAGFTVMMALDSALG